MEEESCYQQGYKITGWSYCETMCREKKFKNCWEMRENQDKKM